MIDRKELIFLAAEAAVEAGKEILGVYREDEIRVDIKDDNSPLTEADLRSHRTIMKYLGRTPIPVLSEESAHAAPEERADWHQCWIVDPLDGTKEFIKRNGEFTVNIALINEGSPVLGVIYTPVTGELYFGIVGEGAWKTTLGNSNIPFHSFAELTTISQSLPFERANSGGITVVASRSHMTDETASYISELERIFAPVKVLSRGSSLKICMVAEGTADVYPRFAPTMEWDTAAGDAIARSAGCLVCNARTGDELIYNKRELLNPWFTVKRKGGLTI